MGKNGQTKGTVKFEPYATGDFCNLTVVNNAS